MTKSSIKLNNEEETKETDDRQDELVQIS